MRRKLRDLVVFPVEGLDLSRIVASDTDSPPATAVPSNTETPKKSKKKKGKPSQSKSSKSKNNGGGHPIYLEEPEGKDHYHDSPDATDTTEPMSNDDGRSEMLYDLYGVVHHQGALSGGHYVASLKSELDGQWRLFNDAQIYEIHNRDVVDSSAYILFYIRRDVKDARLSDFWDTTAREGAGLSEQDMDRLLSGQGASGGAGSCVIS